LELEDRMNNLREAKLELKALRWRDRRRIHHRCFEEGFGSWQFVVALVAGLPCAVFATIAMVNYGGWFAEHSSRISAFLYSMIVVSVLARQSDRFLPKALEEFQQENA